jgi:hypothetical protein
MISLLEAFPFKLSDVTVVKLLEARLLMRFKTEAPKDAQLDSFASVAYPMEAV